MIAAALVFLVGVIAACVIGFRVGHWRATKINVAIAYLGVSRYAAKAHPDSLVDQRRIIEGVHEQIGALTPQDVHDLMRIADAAREAGAL